MAKVAISEIFSVYIQCLGVNDTIWLYPNIPNDKPVSMNPLSRMPGFIIILIAGLIIVGYGVTLQDLNPNWVIAIGIVLLIIAVLSIVVVR